MFKSRFLTQKSCSYHIWTQPTGHNTSINIYNCVTRKIEPLIVKNKNAVTWYTCGPTVYDSSHIGHASCYVKLDIIQRILKNHFGLNLVTCMNITDVDDKIIKRAIELKVDYKEVSKQYEKEFWKDLGDLNIPQPDVVVRVTENMPLIIDFIKKLEEEGYAYKTTDNSVYFDSSRSCHSPGRLQNINEIVLVPSNPHKLAPADFALWKSLKNQNEPFFDSPWGKGRPGWHIECSTLASHIFGSNIDIHAGGLDLRFPHHENEEIQSCAFHDNHQWVNYWLHTGQLHLKHSTKMSKSLKNTISIQDMLKDVEPDVFRLTCVMNQYSSPMEYHAELLDTAKNVLKCYKIFLVACREVKQGFIRPVLNNDVLCELLMRSVKEIHEAFCDNFNTPRVIQILNHIVSKMNCMINSAANYQTKTTDNVYYLVAIENLVLDTLNTFGLDFDEAKKLQSEDSTEFINLLVHFRQEVRNLGLQDRNKDLLKLCDNLRDDLKKAGLSIRDHEKLSSWSR
ncbi:unnamed protein product [Ceutorhynchus assimilis]|uniref:cysteine--tRNA ligase n=1 Tax=Ceutorhynchus assimilis TaxID=467358 RepID=A0A9N9MZ78_9CUCU|nr:unnamed protein product [Ceutorhynchus assimilis]